MRTIAAPTILLTLALAACSPDTSSNPFAASTQSPAASRSESDKPAGAPREKSIQGTFEATETDQVRPGTALLDTRLEGTGTASHLGRYTAIAQFTVNLATGAGSGSIVFTAANGDRITAITTGQAVDAGGFADI